MIHWIDIKCFHQVQLLFIFLFLPSFSNAFVPRGDTKYSILERDQYRLIFSNHYKNSIKLIDKNIQSQIDSMSQFQNHTLDEKITVILVSPQAQIPNAFASIFPSNTIGMFPSGMAGRTLSMPFWFTSIFEHELNHIYQMSHSNMPHLIRKILKLPSFVFFTLLTPYPNLLLPLFILEGDAVLKESILQNHGGRLYNGDSRALVFSQIKHYRHQIPKFIKENLLRFSFTAHTGREKYLHGGYLTAMLAEVFSHQDIHSFFKTDKEKPSKDLLKKIKESNPKNKLSKDFKNSFSFKYWPLFIDDLGQAYFNYYLKAASRQISSPEPVLFNSFVCSPFNRFGKDIFFLTSDKLKSRPILRILDTKTKTWTHKNIDLPLGKVFKFNQKYYSRSSKITAPNTIQYSLFSEGIHSLPQFASKYIEDIQNKNILYIDVKNNLEGFKLHFNDRFYSHTHSNALFDQKGNIYYFKQKSSNRVLYKNKSPLFSYRGFYGNLIDIDPKGVIYFTGSTPYGSSIYQYKNNTISKSTASSDTIIQAKKINRKEFLACEVTPFGYEYKIIPIKTKRGPPVLYKYGFKTRTIQAQRQPNSFISKTNKKTPFHPASNQETSAEGAVQKTSAHNNSSFKRKLDSTSSKAKPPSLKYKPYSPLKNIRFKSAQFAGFSVGLFSVLGGGLLFSDELLRHSIQFIYGGGFAHPFVISSFEDASEKNYSFAKLISQKGILLYLNQIYRLFWEAGYIWETLSYTGFDDIAYLSLNYPLLKKGRWFSSLSSFKNLQIRENAGHWRGAFRIGYSQQYPYQHAPRKQTQLSIFLDYIQDYEQGFLTSDYVNGFKTGAALQSVFHIKNDLYFYPALSHARSFSSVNPAKIILYSKTFSNPSNSSSLYLNSRIDDTGSHFVSNDLYSSLFQTKYTAQSISTASIGFKKAFYFPSRFLGLLNLAPLLRTRWVLLKQNLSADSTGLNDYDPENLVSNVQSYVGRLLQKERQPLQTSYQQWLEWTLGVESSFLIKEKALLTLGFSYGFKTPVQFWKISKEKGKETTEQVHVNQAPSSIPSSLINRLPLDSHFQFYIKMPF